MKIKLIGIGGAGRNILNTIIDSGYDRANTVYMDTDINALPASKSAAFVQLDKATFKGRGAGGDPHYGLAAAQHTEGEILTSIQGCECVILFAGLGGGVGSGATPYIASIAKERMKFDVMAIVSLPTCLEGERRNSQATEACVALHKLLGENLHVVNIPNVNLAKMFDAANDLILDKFKELMVQLHR